MALGAPVSTSVDVQQSAPGGAAAQPGTMTPALDSNAPKHSNAVKRPFTTTPKAKHSSSSSNRRRAGPDHRSRFVGEYGRRSRFVGDYRRMGPGTPRFNLMLSMGGLY
jgi:hypothetical protein